MSSDDVFFKAMLARDHRFDGKFFVGVKTTGIYCRPICPAKPKRKNVEFFSSALAAERAGYRPCLRCRPEAAPLSPAWVGKSAIVQRALREIANLGHIPGDAEAFAERFGVSSRHLRRLFLQEIGQSPKQISDTNRLNFARKLVVETQLPLTTIAMNSGFASLRRFNAAFKARFHRAPTTLRRKLVGRRPSGVQLTLSLRPPYDFATILHYYRIHCISGVESISENTYERVFRMDKQVGVLRVSPDLKAAKLKLEIWGADASVFFSLSQRIRQMFDLDSDPLLVANTFSESGYFQKLWRHNPGLRIPRSWDVFEGVVTTILGQLVSIDQAGRLIEQLVRAYGEKVKHPVSGEDRFLFPTPRVLAKADLVEVRTTGARKKSIRQFSVAVVKGEFDLSPNQDATLFREQVLAIPGIGSWSAEYMALRALGDTDAFPRTDLVLQKALAQRSDLDLEVIRPWRAYAALYLWREHSKKGVPNEIRL